MDAMTGKEILQEMKLITGYKGALNIEGAFRMSKEAIGIIKRQQEEIEKLKRQIENIEQEAELEWELKEMLDAL
jgi:polyhydroxyalkanoate synthesis regulator phasin